MRSLIHSLLWVPLIIAFCASQVVAQTGPTSWTATPFNPPALPLGVRSPYLNSWYGQGNQPAPVNHGWSGLWQGGITGWYASAVVDGVPYQLLGDANLPGIIIANQTAVLFTPTRTSFLFRAGPVQFNATFMSPIEPTDLVRQSLPFTYFYMSASSLDGAQHAVKMYSDISAEFISGDDGKIVTWTTDITNDHIILEASLQTPQAFTEISNHAQDATQFHCMKKQTGTTWQISGDVATRTAFANGTLSNTADTNFRAVSDHFPVFGLAQDFGSIVSTPAPAVWALGVLRSPVVQYRDSTGFVEQRSPYFASAFTSLQDAAEMAVGDFDRALAAAVALDAKVTADAQAVSGEYADLVALSMRQAMGAIEITLGKTSDGASFNATDIKAFMKNMGNAGSSGSPSVNSVDVLYAAFPIYLYLNPELGGYLLAPLLEYQDSSLFTLPYAALSLGSAYPNATSSDTNVPHDYGIEESANMIIMTLAHAQSSGNGTLISKHYTLLRDWADYLVNNSLSFTNQRSPDETTLPLSNQTNIALKGIIAIAAMSKISAYAGVTSDSSKYNSTATSYIQQWQTLSTSSDNTHIMMNFGIQQSSGLLYNLYADKLLQLNLVPSSVYETQTVFYNNLAPQIKFGLPLDNSDTTESRSDWMMFAAATTTHQSTRDFMVSQLHQYASASLNGTVYAVSYDPTTAKPSGGINSPAQGGMFAFLALNQTIKTVNIPKDGSTIPGNSSATSSGKSNTGAIAGGVIGGLAVLGVLGAVFFFLRRRRTRQEMQYSNGGRGDLLSFRSGGNNGKPPGFVDEATFEPFSYTPSHGGTITYHSGAAPSLTNGSSAFDPTSPRSLAESGSGVTAGHGSGAGTGTGAGAAVGAATMPYAGAKNARDSAYFRRGHRRGESSSDVGPSASQVGAGTASAVSSGAGSGSGSGSGRGRGALPPAAALAKQSLVTEELRSEVDNLRRDLERIRLERDASGVVEEAPPQYTDM